MKKLICMIIIVLISIMSIFSYSLAVTNKYSVNMYLENTQYKQGDIIYIPIKLEDIDIENGIVGFDTIIEYDEDVFETVRFQKANQWQMPILVEKLIHATTESMKAVEGNQEIMTLVLKVKNHAKLGETEIELSKFDVSDTETTIANDGAAVSVEILEGEKVQEDVVPQMQNEKPDVDIQVSLIIGVTTALIIVLLIIYFIDKNKKSKDK